MRAMRTDPEGGVGIAKKPLSLGRSHGMCHARKMGVFNVDGCRRRRTKDRSRKTWYAYYRQVRFARWLGFRNADADLIQGFRRRPVSPVKPCSAWLYNTSRFVRLDRRADYTYPSRLDASHDEWRNAMHATSQVMVTLSNDLLRHLCNLARTLDVPIQWIVAGMVCDTIDRSSELAKNPVLLPVHMHRRTSGDLSASAAVGAVSH